MAPPQHNVHISVTVHIACNPGDHRVPRQLARIHGDKRLERKRTQAPVAQRVRHKRRVPKGGRRNDHVIHAVQVEIWEERKTERKQAQTRCIQCLTKNQDPGSVVDVEMKVAKPTKHHNVCVTVCIHIPGVQAHHTQRIRENDPLLDTSLPVTVCIRHRCAHRMDVIENRVVVQKEADNVPPSALLRREPRFPAVFHNQTIATRRRVAIKPIVPVVVERDVRVRHQIGDPVGVHVACDDPSHGRDAERIFLRIQRARSVVGQNTDHVWTVRYRYVHRPIRPKVDQRQ